MSEEEWNGLTRALSTTSGHERCLPKPVFRYPALFKENYIERCKGHALHLNLQSFTDLVPIVEKEEGESFFEKVIQLQREGSGIHYHGDFGIIKTEEHPKIMREFIKNRTTISRYYVRDNILDKIANA